MVYSAIDALPHDGPVIYKARGLAIGTWLCVFDDVYHVHSEILNLYSGYFFQFLDSANIRKDKADDNTVKYVWVTKFVNKGKDWQLVGYGKSVEDLGSSEYFTNTEHQRVCFKKLLDAMYNVHYKLDASELITLTSLARLYKALPAVSRSLDRAFVESKDTILNDIRKNPCMMLSAAAELRHARLFKEAMVWCLGPFNNPIYNKLEDRSLRKLARYMSGMVRGALFNGYSFLIEDIAKGEMKEEEHECATPNEESLFILKEGLFLARKNSVANYGDIKVPQFFRDLYEAQNGGKLGCAIKEHFGPLLDSSLKLGHATALQAGKCEHGTENHFLIDMVTEEDLPWDPAELDW